MSAATRKKPAEGYRCPICGECDWLIPEAGWPCPGCFEVEPGERRLAQQLELELNRGGKG